MFDYHTAKSLVGMVGPVNCFSTDEGDECRIQREDGTVQGIFKTWAVPVIPFMDMGRMGWVDKLNVLPRLWPKVSPMRGQSLQERLLFLATAGDDDAKLALDTLDSWSQRCVQNPLYLQRSLERVRLNSWIAYQRLCRIFSNEPLASELPLRICQLTSRLQLALGLHNPFYNLEALVGNPASLLGAEFKATSGNAGVLDVISFLLPAAFRWQVTAKRLNWKGLSWPKLQRQTQKLLAGGPSGGFQNRIKRVLLNVARLAGIPPHHVLFVANALEWIPGRVGGKVDDLISTEGAVEQIEEAIARHHKKGADGLSVLSNMNALIRFLNWAPLVEGPENFQGRNWTYASVCDTTNDLLALLIGQPQVWRDGFGRSFKKVLLPQLEKLDVTSAKGRFLLHLLLTENRLKEEFFPAGLDKDWQRKTAEKVRMISRQPLKAPTMNVYHPSLVGGKPFHLALSSQALGQRHSLEGFVISSEVISGGLLGGAEIERRIMALDQASILDQKLKLGRDIQSGITDMPGGWFGEYIGNGLLGMPSNCRGGFKSWQWNPDEIGDGLWSVRSSTQDEAEARGVYETFLPVPTDQLPRRILACIASYYSEAAIKFRMTTGSGDRPDIAVLCQPYQFTTKGGVATMKGGRYRISVGPNPAMVTSGKDVWDEIVCPVVFGSPSWKREFYELVGVLEQLEEMFGPVQTEWLVNSSGELVILQLEFLSSPESEPTSEPKDRLPVRTELVHSLGELAKVERALIAESGMIAIELGEAIDLDSFQGELLGLLVRCGKRIAEIKLPKPISPSCHFANICRYLGIKLL